MWGIELKELTTQTQETPLRCAAADTMILENLRLHLYSVYWLWARASHLFWAEKCSLYFIRSSFENVLFLPPHPTPKLFWTKKSSTIYLIKKINILNITFLYH